MTIKTTYDIGQRIWVVYANKGEVCIYDEKICKIQISKNAILYIGTESLTELREYQIVPYEETGMLVELIRQTMREIRKKEQKT